MARTREELWQVEDSIWKDAAISTIIPSKRPSPQKSFFPSSSVLKTNVLSNLSPSLNSSPKFLPELPISSPKFTYSFPQSFSSLHHLSRPKSHISKKHLHKSKHHRHKNIHDRELEKAAVKVLAELHMAEDRPTSSDKKDKNIKLAKPLELPDGDNRKNMIPKVVLRDIGHIIQKACPKLRVSSKTVLNGADDLKQSSHVLHDEENCKETTPETLSEPLLPAKSTRNPIVTSPLPIISPSKTDNGLGRGLNSNARNLTSDKSSDLNVPSFDILGAMAPSFAKVPASFSTKASSLPISPAIQPFPFTSITKSIPPSPLLSDRPLNEPCSILKEQPAPPKSDSSHLVKPQVNKTICHIKNGFLGFPEEDGRKLRKTRFHVNTNILASSLDLLDLHKNVGVTAGSPYCCASCDIVFSSVKHCKYHQSVMSAEVTDSQVTDVQEDGFWLCPWCPTIALSSSYFEDHKVKCREKGRCHQESKASSVRKNASASSRRRSKPSSSSVNLNPSPIKSNNSFKVLHGQVIPV